MARLTIILFCLFSYPLTFAEDIFELYQQNNFSKVIELANKKLKENNSSEQKYSFLILKAYALSNLKDYQAANTILAEVPKTFKNREDFLHLEAFLLVQNNQHDKAIKALENLDKDHKISNDEKLTLIHLYLQTNKIANARSLVMSFSQQEREQSPAIQELLGYMDLRTHSYRSSIYHYRKAVALKQTNPENYLALEQIYGTLHQDDKAIEVLQEGVKANPHNPYLLKRLAHQYEIQGDAKAALENYEKVLALKPDDTFALRAKSRLKKELAFHSYTFVSKSNESQAERANLNSSKKNIDVLTVNQSFSQKLDTNTVMGINYQKTTHEKNLAKDHRIDDENVFLHTQWFKQEHFLSLDVGFTQYTANDIGEGSEGHEQAPAGNALYQFRHKDNSFIFAYSKLYYVQDFTTYLDASLLETYILQNTYDFSHQMGLLIRGLKGVSQNLHYKVYSIAPIYRSTEIPGLITKLFFERYLIDEQNNYYQYFISFNYDRDLTDRFGASINLDVGRREIDDVLFEQLDWTFKYSYNDLDDFVIIFHTRKENNGQIKQVTNVSEIGLGFNLYF